MLARIATTVLALAMTALLVACGSSAIGTPAGGALTVTDAWVREAAAGATSAAYLQVTNARLADDMLVGVSAPELTDSASLHETTSSSSGMTGMQHTASISIPAGHSVALQPGGYHIMLMNLKRELKAGTVVHLILTFEQAGVVAVDAQVRAQ